MLSKDEPYIAGSTVVDVESQPTGTGSTTPPACEKLETPAETKHQFDLPVWRKCMILFVVSWMTLAVTFSSTSYLPASPEIAVEFSTTTEILNYTNAGVMLAMGFSSLIWGPVGRLIGRKYAYNFAILMLCGCSAGAAASINMRMFTVMRILAGLTGTSFMVSGQTILADIFEPVWFMSFVAVAVAVSDCILQVVRGTAVGFFMVGSVAGPAIGMQCHCSFIWACVLTG